MPASQPAPDASAIPALPAAPAVAPGGTAPSTAPRHAFDYAIVRIVPRVERDEFVNAGAIVHCPALRFLGARVELDRSRLIALAPHLDSDRVDEVERYLQGMVDICAGVPEGGPIARFPPSQRFHWLIAPRSHVVQTSPIHAGLCAHPAAALEHLMETMVRQRVPSHGGEAHAV